MIVEHIYPRSKGGTNDSFNIITACSDCNVRKNNKILDFNVILTLWQIVEKRNKKNDINWDSLKVAFDKSYPTNQN
jgi:5-methylcytosine-specific restriction endonuclease McrA